MIDIRNTHGGETPAVDVADDFKALAMGRRGLIEVDATALTKLYEPNNDRVGDYTLRIARDYAYCREIQLGLSTGKKTITEEQQQRLLEIDASLVKDYKVDERRVELMLLLLNAVLRSIEYVLIKKRSYS